MWGRSVAPPQTAAELEDIINRQAALITAAVERFVPAGARLIHKATLDTGSMVATISWEGRHPARPADTFDLSKN